MPKRVAPQTATSDNDEPAPKKGKKLSPAEKDQDLLEKLLKANKKLDVEDNEAILGASPAFLLPSYLITYSSQPYNENSGMRRARNATLTIRIHRRFCWRMVSCDTSSSVNGAWHGMLSFQFVYPPF